MNRSKACFYLKYDLLRLESERASTRIRTCFDSNQQTNAYRQEYGTSLKAYPILSFSLTERLVDIVRWMEVLTFKLLISSPLSVCRQTLLTATAFHEQTWKAVVNE